MPSSGSSAAPPGLRGILTAAALLGATGVMIGAFGAHGLEGRVTPDRLVTFETGVQYHLTHALSLMALAALTGWLGPVAARGIATFWILGTVVFSGSLYLLVILDLSVLGAITPVGGILFITGWVWLAVSAWRLVPEHPAPPDGLS